MDDAPEIPHEEPEHRRERLEHIRIESSRSFDRALLALSTGAFSLSLLFYRFIAPGPVIEWKPLLVIAWVLFAVCLMMVVASFQLAEYVASRELDEMDRAAGTRARVGSERLEWATRYVNWTAGGLFALAVCLLLTFAGRNLYMGGPMADGDKRGQVVRPVKPAPSKDGLVPNSAVPRAPKRPAPAPPATPPAPTKPTEAGK